MLHIAANDSNVKIARLLLDHGATVNAQTPQLRTPLHFASQRGSQECARLLLNHGADSNVQDAAGDTPLHLAFRGAHERVLTLLINSGASAAIVNKKGEPAVAMRKAQGASKNLLSSVLFVGVGKFIMALVLSGSA